MKCNKCGSENLENVNYCTNCGTKIAVENNENKIVENNTNNSKNKIPVLSWVSLGLLCMQLIGFLCMINSFLYKFIGSKLSIIFELPYVVASLILAIISRVKNKDKMSLILIIVDSVVIFITIVFIILAAILAAYTITSIINMFEGCATQDLEIP